jgi:hypothetical protein
MELIHKSALTAEYLYEEKKKEASESSRNNPRLVS